MRKNRWVWGAIVVAVLVLLSLFVAPNRANLRQGSTYSRAPDGYGAWYAYMQKQGADIQRWQRPLGHLIRPVPPQETPIEKDAVPIEYRQRAEGRGRGWIDGDLSLTLHSSLLTLHSSLFTPQSTAKRKQATVLSTQPITLLQVDNGQGQLGSLPQDWIEQGNVVIQLGRTAAVEGLGLASPVTRSPFTSVLSSTEGGVKVETSRRYTELQGVPKRSRESIASRLTDPYGAVVLERKVGKGKVITAITPHLAANAYQDEPGNFKLLKQLVTEAGNPIWVDEYLHGYKDRESAGGGGNLEGSSGGEEASGSLLSYLSRTPLLLVVVQAIVFLLVLIWGLNRRLGPAMALANPKVDNSEAYMQALAAVLRKANCSEFVMETIGKAEQLQVQRSLGLGNDLLDPAQVVAAWVEQTGRSASDLEEVLNYADRRRFSEAELRDWLEKVRSVRQHLP